MILHDEAYDAALGIVEKAVAAFASGNRERAEQLLTSLDRVAIDRDREQLQALARTATVSTASPAAQPASSHVPPEIMESVQKRDGYRCRYTGRRLVDTRVFKEVDRLSEVFRFDEHHSIRTTKRGPGGHPLVRTHGAAYEHAVPRSLDGGGTTTDNIVLTSVELNESKGAKILELIEVPTDDWCGLTQYLPTLQMQPSVAERPERSSAGAGVARPSGVRVRPRSPGKASALARIREAAEGLEVIVFALADDPEAEDRFGQLRLQKENAYFATKTKTGPWMIHRMYCSSLAFDIDAKLTRSPKVYSECQEELLEWAKRFGVNTTGCRRCGTAV